MCVYMVCVCVIYVYMVCVCACAYGMCTVCTSMCVPWCYVEVRGQLQVLDLVFHLVSELGSLAHCSTDWALELPRISLSASCLTMGNGATPGFIQALGLQTPVFTLAEQHFNTLSTQPSLQL